MLCILIFHGNNGYVNAPQCYVIRTLRVLFEGDYRVKGSTWGQFITRRLSILECDVTHVAYLRCSRRDYHMCNIFGFRNLHIGALKNYDNNGFKFAVHVRGLF